MFFISYSSKDVEEVMVLAGFVETTGQKCWYSDRYLMEKDSWADRCNVVFVQTDPIVSYFDE